MVNVLPKYQFDQFEWLEQPRRYKGNFIRLPAVAACLHTVFDIRVLTYTELGE